MSAPTKTPELSGRSLLISVSVLFTATLIYGSATNPQFWLSADQRGDRLMAQKQFRQAATAYTDPWHIGVAQYRNGDFKQAAQTFARVPGAVGAYNQGNACLMQGAYDDAIASYDRALGFRPGWQEAEENKALAQARQKSIDDAGKSRAEESAEAYKPDATVFDQKGEDHEVQPKTINGEQMSDAELRASWLRRVQTSPGDFLQAKFAYQAAHQDQTADDSTAGPAKDEGQ
jgi:Ca-activated chloride channel family protein